MPNPNNQLAADDWAVTGDETRGSQGSIRIKFLGALGGLARAQMDVWAMTPDDLVAFLRGCAATVEHKYGRIITPAGSRN